MHPTPDQVRTVAELLFHDAQFAVVPGDRYEWHWRDRPWNEWEFQNLRTGETFTVWRMVPIMLLNMRVLVEGEGD